MSFDKFYDNVKAAHLPVHEQLALIDRYDKKKHLLQGDILKACLLRKKEEERLPSISEASMEASRSIQRSRSVVADRKDHGNRNERRAYQELRDLRLKSELYKASVEKQQLARPLVIKSKSLSQIKKMRKCKASESSIIKATGEQNLPVEEQKKPEQDFN